MTRNVEVKARIESIDALRTVAAGLANEGPFELFQSDTFFQCETGRLKLRDFGDGSGELIYYRRSCESGPRESFYLRSKTSTPDLLRESLALAYGENGRVRKRRTQFLVGRTRIHLDAVEDLGSFLELEVVMGAQEPIEKGVDEVNRLMELLGIRPSQLVEGAYVDLLAQTSDGAGSVGPRSRALG